MTSKTTTKSQIQQGKMKQNKECMINKKCASNRIAPWPKNNVFFIKGFHALTSIAKYRIT